MGATGDSEKVRSLMALVGSFGVGVGLEHASKVTVTPCFSLWALRIQEAI